jgi:hypothetical protein
MFASKDTLLTRPSGGYNIARSVRLRSSASGYFSRTPASSGNLTTWTFSAWVKLGTIGVARCLFSCGANTSNVTSIDLRADHRIQLYTSTAGGQVASLVWNPNVYRDPSAWYHFVIVADTTNATSTNRYKFYVNNVQVTGISTTAGEDNFGAQNAATNVNSTVAHSLGRKQASANEYFDGYVTEVNLIDGQALTPSSFGETDSITGVWKPKAYSGTYGTNGFELNFSDNSASTAATIGKDYSGNGNNWTPNNISVTAGVTYDSMVDSPTVGEFSSNYAVLNPLAVDASSPPTITNGNLAISSTGALATIPMPTGKWYWEATCTSTDADQAVGAFSTSESGKTSISGASNPTYGFIYQANGNARQNGTVVQTWSTFTNNDILSFTYDASIYQLKAYKNNSLVGTITLTTPLSGDSYVPMACCLGGSFAFNFGQRPFTYTPPTGFVALNTYNLPASTIKNGAAYMAATTYTGNGTSQTITNAGGFAPDLVWIKGRSYVDSHTLFDTVRGATQSLSSNTTTAEVTRSTALTAFTSTGFTVSSDTLVNYNANTLVGWQWKAGGTSASNTNGSITSTVSAGATQGFSVVTYTGNGTGTPTIGHGLGVAPAMIIAKTRSTANGWLVYHQSLGATQAIILSGTNAASVGTNWGNTTPTSTVFYVNGANNNISAATYVAYCFAAVAGYSAFGSYTANASADGPFIYTGFRPRWIMIKNSSAVVAWIVWDSSRNTYNVSNSVLQPNVSDAEATAVPIDIVSNGFKIRTTDGAANSSTNTYIYAAFAESPFKTSLAR